MTSQKFTSEDDDLLNELGIIIESKPVKKLTAKEERIIHGFKEIVRFYEKHDRLPSLEDAKDDFEKVYAVRLKQIRKLKDQHDLLSEYDSYGLLSQNSSADDEQIDTMSDDQILDELGVDVNTVASITTLKNVKPKSRRDSADEIANRTACPDFELFKPLFAKVRNELNHGIRYSSKYQNDATISKGDFYIIGGQIAYIAEMGADFTNSYGRKNSKLRVVFDNGTQTDGMLMRSFQRALNKDANPRRIESLGVMPLFSDDLGEDDIKSGTIYVLRSMSSHPLVAENRDIVHKIGVTGGDVKKRISNAKFDSTFLMADVEIVAEYRLANINRVKLEALIHKFFSDVQLNIQVQDRFGKTVTIKEWFLAPLFVIDQMIEKLKEGNLGDYYYDKNTASIKRLD